MHWVCLSHLYEFLWTRDFKTSQWRPSVYSQVALWNHCMSLLYVYSNHWKLHLSRKVFGGVLLLLFGWFPLWKYLHLGQNMSLWVLKILILEILLRSMGKRRGSSFQFCAWFLKQHCLYHVSKDSHKGRFFIFQPWLLLAAHRKGGKPRWSPSPFHMLWFSLFGHLTNKKSKPFSPPTAKAKFQWI